MQYNLTFMSSIAALELVIHLHLLSITQLADTMTCAVVVFGLIYVAIAVLSLCAIWTQ